LDELILTNGNMPPRGNRKYVRNLSAMDMENLQEQLQQMGLKVDRVFRAIIGDQEMEQPGLVHKVQRHEDYINKQKLMYAKLTGMAIAAGAIGGVVVELGIQFFFK
jgi:hypothetical protein